MNKTRLVIRSSAVLATAAVLLAATGCMPRKKQGGPPGGGFPPSVVKVRPAERMDAPILIQAFGQTEDQASVDVVPQVSGLLVEVLIGDGAVVTNGQTLFRIDPSDYETRVRQVEGLLAVDRANLELSRTTLERNRPLLGKKLISQEQFDTLKTRFDAASAQLQTDAATLEEARRNLGRCTITSALAGACSKVLADAGNLVQAGMTRLVNIRSYDPMEVEFSVPEQHLPAIRQAMATGPVRIEITPKGDTNRYEGTLYFLDNAVSSQTGTLLLRGRLPNPDHRLWSRQFVEVNVYAGVVPGAVMVPESAVQYGKQGPYLYVVTPESKVDLRPVQTGVRVGNLLQVTGPVAPGDPVVELGQFMLFPGATVSDAAKMPPAGGPPGGASSGLGDAGGQDGQPSTGAHGGTSPAAASAPPPAAHPGTDSAPKADGPAAP